MLTIGQLASYTGVTVRAVRHYHQIGLLPEPDRDASGYRRYGATAGIPEDRRHPHCRKHSIAMHLIAAGGDVLTVRDWLGHRNIRNTLTYAQILSPKRDAEVARLVETSGQVA